MIDTSWLDTIPDGKRRAYYFTTSEFLVENLRARHLKISAFSACNDMFELSHVDLKDRRFRIEHRQWVEEVGESIGLICFSKKWTSPLMWAHYTDRGKGVCLVCDVDDSLLTPVSYEKNRTTDLNVVLPRSDSPSFRKFCSTKADIWAYEEELRYFVDLPQTATSEKNELRYSGMWFHALGDKISLVGIINGPRPALGKTELVTVCGKSTNYFQCRPAFGSFTMTPQHDSNLWKK